MLQQKATILWNRPLSPDCFHLALSAQSALTQAAAGQFVMLRVGDSESPLLRRPFSIAGVLDQTDDLAAIELLVKVVGVGTRMLSEMRAGERLDIVGPLGRGFRVYGRDRRIYLAAGGIGVAPIRFLASRLLAKGVKPGQCHLFLGGAGQADLLCHDEFDAMGLAVTVTTDDGSHGSQCLITDPLEMAIAAEIPDRVYACGPHGMLACVAGIVERFKVPCQVSIETHMACGLGVCLGCAVQGRRQKDAYLHACINGPVFDVGEIELAP